MGQFIAAVLIVSLVLWLCMVSIHVAAVVAVIVVFYGGFIVVAGFITVVSNFMSHRKLLQYLASCRCPQCRQAFGEYTGSGVPNDTAATSEIEGYASDQGKLAEWVVQCSNCEYVSYFVPDTLQVYSEAWSDRKENEP